MEPPERLVLDILQVEWDNTNSYDLTPKISFGWFDESSGIPQVTISQPDESPSDGGNTGFSGISVDGPTQRFTGTIEVNVWCRPSDLENANTVNPRQYNQAAAMEIQRIIGNNNDRPENPRTGNMPVNFLSYAGKTPVPEPDDTIKMLRHYNVVVSYGYGPTSR